MQAQVDPGAQLGCDPSMCGYLAAAGVPAASQVVFNRGAGVPGAAAFVLSTPALRSQSGDSLASQRARRSSPASGRAGNGWTS